MRSFLARPSRIIGLISCGLFFTLPMGGCPNPGDTGGTTGPQGPAGPQGDTGPQGPAGATGATGASGASPFTLSGSNAIFTTGNVGIGTTSPGNPLTVAGIIQSTTGGFRFPDGTTLTSANSATGDINSIAAGAGLTGGGFSGDVSLFVDFAGNGAATSVARSDHFHNTLSASDGSPAAALTIDADGNATLTGNLTTPGAFAATLGITTTLLTSPVGSNLTLGAGISTGMRLISTTGGSVPAVVGGDIMNSVNASGDGMTIGGGRENAASPHPSARRWCLSKSARP